MQAPEPEPVQAEDAQKADDVPSLEWDDEHMASDSSPDVKQEVNVPVPNVTPEVKTPQRTPQRRPMGRNPEDIADWVAGLSPPQGVGIDATPPPLVETPVVKTRTGRVVKTPRKYCDDFEELRQKEARSLEKVKERAKLQARAGRERSPVQMGERSSKTARTPVQGKANPLEGMAERMQTRVAARAAETGEPRPKSPEKTRVAGTKSTVHLQTEEQAEANAARRSTKTARSPVAGTSGTRTSTAEEPIAGPSGTQRSGRTTPPTLPPIPPTTAPTKTKSGSRISNETRQSIGLKSFKGVSTSDPFAAEVAKWLDHHLEPQVDNPLKGVKRVQKMNLSKW